MYYFGARYYEPVISRWISPDPILGSYLPTGNKEKDQQLSGGGGVFRPLNISLYCYGYSNPIKYLDPDGNEDVTPVITLTLPRPPDGPLPWDVPDVGPAKSVTPGEFGSLAGKAAGIAAGKVPEVNNLIQAGKAWADKNPKIAIPLKVGVGTAKVLYDVGVKGKIEVPKLSVPLPGDNSKLKVGGEYNIKENSVGVGASFSYKINDNVNMSLDANLNQKTPVGSNGNKGGGPNGSFQFKISW